MIIKLSKQKDAAKIRSSKKKKKKKGKGMDLYSLGIRGKVYINDSLCKYDKFLCLQSKQFIQTFWVTNGVVRLKAVENGQ